MCFVEMLDEMMPMYPTKPLLKVGIAERPSDSDDGFQQLSDAITKALQAASDSEYISMKHKFLTQMKE